MSKKKNNLISEDIVKLAGEIGAKVALEMLEKEKKKASRERRNRRLRNTKLLMRNYRMLVAHMESAIYNAQQIEENESAIDILDLMESTLYDEDLYVESIKRSAERTYIIMSHVNEMLRLYEIYCARSMRQEDQRRYSVLYALYIADPTTTAKEIADKENIDLRTVYKDIDAAVEKLSALIFGIDGLNVTR